MMNRSLFVIPDWSAPEQVHAGTTCRQGGVSLPPYDSLNLAQHVGDDPQAVAQNRQRLALPGEPCWLQQVHGVKVAKLDAPTTDIIEADAAYTRQVGVICAVLTADCLPVLLCDTSGSEVAAIHAGWRGLCDGVIEATVGHFSASTDKLMAWLGPAIGPEVYEIGEEVRQSFVDRDPQATQAFVATRPGHWLMDLYALARQRLQHLGVGQISGGQYCTYQDATRFYSYRRDGITGRMASLIWLGD